MSKARSRARQRALQALYQWQITADDPAVIEEQFLTAGEMGKADPGFFHDLLYEVTTHLDELDGLLTPRLDRPLEQVDLVERAILRMGCYELRYRPETPYRVVINEAVELAKIFGGEQGHKYVNSVLDKLARQLRTQEIRPR
ncbi:MAG: transcription antitermination factor NusB [Thiohalomonadaceae bacterium]